MLFRRVLESYRIHPGNAPQILLSHIVESVTDQKWMRCSMPDSATLLLTDGPDRYPAPEAYSCLQIYP
jgi:hypothetical protein